MKNSTLALGWGWREKICWPSVFRNTNESVGWKTSKDETLAKIIGLPRLLHTYMVLLASFTLQICRMGLQWLNKLMTDDLILWKFLAYLLPWNFDKNYATGLLSLVYLVGPLTPVSKRTLLLQTLCTSTTHNALAPSKYLSHFNSKIYLLMVILLLQIQCMSFQTRRTTHNPLSHQGDCIYASRTSFSRHSKYVLEFIVQKNPETFYPSILCWTNLENTLQHSISFNIHP